MAYTKSNWQKPEKPRVQGVGKAFGKGQEFKAPYDSGMGSDFIRGQKQESDPTRYTGYRTAISTPTASGYSFEQASGLNAEDDSRMLRQRGRKP